MCRGESIWEIHRHRPKTRIQPASVKALLRRLRAYYARLQTPGPGLLASLPEHGIKEALRLLLAKLTSYCQQVEACRMYI